MKKILLFMALVGSLFGDGFKLESYYNDSNSLLINVDENITECYNSNANPKCYFHVFIDTDNNSSTGFYGSDYRITGSAGEIYAVEHTSNNWNDNTPANNLLNIGENMTRIVDNQIYLEFSDIGNPILNNEDHNFTVLIHKDINNELHEEDEKEATLNQNREQISFANNNANNDPIGTINDIIVVGNKIEISGNFTGLENYAILMNTDNNIDTGFGEIGADYLVNSYLAKFNPEYDHNWEWGSIEMNETKTNENITIQFDNPNIFNETIYQVRVETYDNDWNIIDDKTTIPEIISGTNVLDYGVKCDGASDDNDSLQIAFNDYLNWKNKTLIFPENSECIVSTGIKWKDINGAEDNPYIIQGNGTTIKSKGNKQVGDQDQKSWLLWIDNASYINIDNLDFDGNRNSRSDTTGVERGINSLISKVAENESIFQYYYNANLVLTSVQNATFTNVDSDYSVGDGIYIGWRDIALQYPQNIQLNNCSASYAFRNNLTISNCDNCSVNEGSYTNARGVAPEAGIDVECDTKYDADIPDNEGSNIEYFYLKNDLNSECLKFIDIFNVIIKDNYGVGVSVADNFAPKNINIQHNTFDRNHISERSCDLKGMAINAGGMSGNSTIKFNVFENFIDHNNQVNNVIDEDDKCRSLIDFTPPDYDGDFSHVLVESNIFINIQNLINQGNKILYIHSTNGGNHNIVDNNFSNIQGVDINENLTKNIWSEDDAIPASYFNNNNLMP